MNAIEECAAEQPTVAQETDNDESLNIQALQDEALRLWEVDQRSALKLGHALIAVRVAMKEHGAWTAWFREAGLDENRVNYCIRKAEGKVAKRKDPAPLNEPVFSDAQIIDDAVRYFRKHGFPYRKLPPHMCRQEINQLAEMLQTQLLNTRVGYKVADTYHPHRFHAKAIGMRSPIEAFADDKSLRKALKLTLESGGTISDELPSALSVVNGTQACSNFRPGYYTMLIRKHCKKGATVLDTSTGYGGRLVGFMASRIYGKYIGIDPNTLTHEGNKRMVNELGFGDAVELINLPAEDVDVDKYKLRGRCDFAFTSPPYFCKEIYSDEPTQSCNRYKTADEWRNGFLIPMLKLQFDALKPGAFCIVNIAKVKIKTKTYPLDAWTLKDAIDIGFERKKPESFPMARRMGSGSEEVATEPVLVFQKPSAK